MFMYYNKLFVSFGYYWRRVFNFSSVSLARWRHVGLLQVNPPGGKLVDFRLSLFSGNICIGDACHKIPR